MCLKYSTKIVAKKKHSEIPTIAGCINHLGSPMLDHPCWRVQREELTTKFDGFFGTGHWLAMMYKYSWCPNDNNDAKTRRTGRAQAGSMIVLVLAARSIYVTGQTLENIAVVVFCCR